MTGTVRRVEGGRWQREPWPWLLMAGPALAITAGLVTLVLAIRSDDGVVADNYYKRGLAINQTLSRAKHAEQLHMTAQAAFDRPAQRVRVTLRMAGTLPPVLSLRLVHPTRALADQVIEVRAAKPGSYEGVLESIPSGRRLLMLEDSSGAWRLVGVSAGNLEPDIVLTPQ